MGLLSLLKKQPAIVHEQCVDANLPALPAFKYHDYCSGNGTEVRETINQIEAFYYDPILDRYVLIALTRYVFWPSWRYVAWYFSPETGAEASRLNGSGGAVEYAFTDGQVNGGNSKTYAVRAGNVIEVQNTNGLPTATQLATPVVTPANVGGLNISSFAVNRTTKTVAFTGGNSHQLSRYNYGTNTDLGAMWIPAVGFLASAYESDDLMWGLMLDADGGGGFSAIKVNYTTRKFEVFTRLDSSAGDLSGHIAFDTKRKNIAVYRRLADVTTTLQGQDILDIYKPIPVPKVLSAPIPTEPITAFKRTTLVGYFIGEKGEGGAGKSFTVTNSGNGQLKSKTITTKNAGIGLIDYTAGPPGDVDTITLNAEV